MKGPDAFASRFGYVLGWYVLWERKEDGSLGWELDEDEQCDDTLDGGPLPEWFAQAVVAFCVRKRKWPEGTTINDVERELRIGEPIVLVTCHVCGERVPSEYAHRLSTDDGPAYVCEPCQFVADED